MVNILADTILLYNLVLVIGVMIVVEDGVRILAALDCFHQEVLASQHP